MSSTSLMDVARLTGVPIAWPMPSVWSRDHVALRQARDARFCVSWDFKPYENPFNTHSMPITTCDSSETLRAEIEAVRKKVSVDETEDTWDTIAHGIQRLTYLCNNGGCEFPSEMVAGIRSVSRPLNTALGSERSRLSGAAVEFLAALATGLGPSFDPLVSQFIPPLLVLCGRTNKVFTSRAKACILTIVQHTRLPSLLPYLTELAHHKSISPRLTAAEGILACLSCCNPPDLEKETRARVVEDFIKLTARDASADVRKASKEIFKAYKILMPARVDSFIAPLTPVIKKYLDIQTGSSGINGASSNARQKQTSRPPSRSNNSKAMEAGHRHTGSTLSKAPVRPLTDGPTHTTRQRPVVHDPPTAVDNRVPRQRTVSQTHRNLHQPRALHINAQSSGAAQRCLVPPSAPARQAPQHLPSVAVRVLPTSNATSGPQRPPSVQLKLNSAPDRLKATGNGAKRVPLPSAPVNEHAREHATAATDSGGRASNIVDKSRSKLPSQSVEAVAPGKPAVGRKPPEGTRSTSSNKTVPTVPVVVQRPQQRAIKSETSKPNRTAPQQCRAGNVQKSTHPLVKVEKEKSPPLIPLPPSPSTAPTEVALPPSPDCVSRPIDSEAQEKPVVASPSGTTEPAGQQQGDVDSPNTPITTLLSSIQRGFLFTPSSPLSPPQNYLPAPGNLVEKRLNPSDFTRVPTAGTTFCLPLENLSADDLDRHALRDLN